jgi:PAS domain S-box-containing protein
MTNSSKSVNKSDSSILSQLPGMAYRCLYDDSWTMLELAGPVEEITGYQAEDLIGNRVLSFADLIVEEDQVNVGKAVEVGLAGEGSYYIDYRIRSKSGEIVHVWEHGRAIFDSDNQPIELVGYIYNASSKVRKLERRKLMRDAAVELARDPHLARGDVEVFVRHVVAKCCAVLDVSGADVWLFNAEKTQLELLIAYDPANDVYKTGVKFNASRFPAYFAEAVKSRVIDASDAQNDPRTSEFNPYVLIPLNVKSVLHCPIRQGGEMVGFVCLEQVAYCRQWRDEEINFVGDVADQIAHVMSNREIRQSENRLLAEQASNEAKSHFLSIMSHEIRTPLNGVLGVAVLLSMTNLNDQQMEYVGLIEQSGKLLLKIIGDILDFTKINSGRLDIRMQPTDVRGLCSDSVDMVRSQADEQLLKLELFVGDDVPQLCELDSMRVQQVLLNLLSNAIKFTAKGRISLRVDAIKRGDKSLLALTVLDTGVGISDQLAAEIFKPFTQDRMQNLDSSLKGAGLGLPICRGLVSLMDGEIELESELGKGTAFKVLLPLNTAAGHAIEKGNPVRGDSFSGLRVLVAEDNVVNQKVIVGMLKVFSVVPDVCSDGKQALEQVVAARKPYDLILMDCEMPVMNGFESVKNIRELEPPKGQAFIVAVTAHALQEYRERAEKVGMNDYLTKPLKREQLYQLLKHLPSLSVQ